MTTDISKIRAYCGKIYSDIYSSEKEKLEKQLLSKKSSSKENAAQKEAIKAATIEGIKHFKDAEAAVIWKAVYETHIHRKSGIFDAGIISKVVKADQSWKKSSGHAFEEMIKALANSSLENTNIEIILQRDLNVLIKLNEINNEPRDISWLKEQIKSSVFDLYAIVHAKNGKTFCFGCLQSKTSIMDRVTRDREPSLQAMKSFFWSTAIVLDGDFLKLPKFISMVNGRTSEYPENGWHGMYVFSKNIQTAEFIL